jgi:hypothetical protein
MEAYTRELKTKRSYTNTKNKVDRTNSGVTTDLQGALLKEEQRKFSKRRPRYKNIQEI